MPSLFRATSQSMYVTFRHGHVTNIAAQKQQAVNILSVVTQHARRRLRIILSSVTCPTLPYFSTLPPKRHDFREQFIEYKMCVLTFSTTFVGNISRSKKK